jgi:hypothetical protein
LGCTGIVILTTRPPGLDFDLFFFRLAEECLTFAAGFFFIELNPRKRRREPNCNRPVEKAITLRARYIRENTVRVNPGYSPAYWFTGSAEKVDD